MISDDFMPQSRSGFAGALARAGSFVTRWPIIPLAILVVLILAAVFAPVITPYDPLDGNLRERLASPMAESAGPAHLFGTDHVGRDVFSRVVYGSQISLLVAAVALVSGTIVGTFLGLVAGYFGGGFG